MHAPITVIVVITVSRGGGIATRKRRGQRLGQCGDGEASSIVEDEVSRQKKKARIPRGDGPITHASHGGLVRS